LQEELTGGVVDEDVNGAMQQATGVDFAARRLPDDAVRGIDDIEKFVETGGGIRTGLGRHF
jgi:hypothetical protein